MRVLKENVELIIDEKEFSRFAKLGYKRIDVSEQSNQDTDKKVPLSKMKSEDLKKTAEELGLDSDGLNCDELRKIIKDAQGNQ
ncbi:MAG: hypothetical protein ACLTAI_10795 [Thomasclavelia sp.]